MLRVEVSKNSSTAASSHEGELVTSTTTEAPLSASASPSPVIVLTPEEGDAATTSCCCSLSFLTSFDPISPVPPTTTIFMMSFLRDEEVFWGDPKLTREMLWRRVERDFVRAWRGHLQGAALVSRSAHSVWLGKMRTCRRFVKNERRHCNRTKKRLAKPIRKYIWTPAQMSQPGNPAKRTNRKSATA